MRITRKYIYYDANKLDGNLIKLIHKDYIKPDYIILRTSKYKKILFKHGKNAKPETFIYVRDNLISLINNSYNKNGIWVNESIELVFDYIIEFEVIEQDMIKIFTCVMRYEANDLRIVNLTFYPNNKGTSAEKNNIKYGGRIK